MSVHDPIKTNKQLQNCKKNSRRSSVCCCEHIFVMLRLKLTLHIKMSNTVNKNWTSNYNKVDVPKTPQTILWFPINKFKVCNEKYLLAL